MQLNLPALARLVECENLLIAGVGGGYDLLGGLPIQFELRRLGRRPHLASLSFSSALLSRLTGGEQLTPSLLGVHSNLRSSPGYFPELHLARWLGAETGEAETIWCIQSRGGLPVLADYCALVEHLRIDGILLVDGGVDSLVRGDEALTGSPLEDLVTLSAISQLDNVSLRLLTCVGFGAENDLLPEQILENIASLGERGGFLGACALTESMEAFRYYERAIAAFSAQPLQPASAIHAAIAAAVLGQHGALAFNSPSGRRTIPVSPLASLYWTFDAKVVAEQCRMIPALQGTHNFMEAAQAISSARSRLRVRARRPVQRDPA